MEVYFKNLISAEASLEKLVDDLTLLVHGVEDFAKATGVPLAEQSRAELFSGLERLKSACARVKEQAVAGAVATDRIVRAYPYSALAAAFGAGLLVGLFSRR
jgi:ElaB/YqjD/DUF883 family membrane-anchored ribosome-binding protein